jgi:hypothetical protein
MKRPFTLWLLLFFLLFLAFGGLYGGGAMLLDPSGRSLEMDAVLPLLPVADYRLPGLFLLVVMGLGPIGLSYGLLTRRRWGWPGALALGVVLAVWLAVQGAHCTIGGRHAQTPLLNFCMLWARAVKRVQILDISRDLLYTFFGSPQR